jgi:hypothetical protein
VGVAGVVFLSRNGTLTAFEWSGVVFFAAGAAVCLSRLVRPRPRLIIEQGGMTAVGFGVGQIRWTDVQRVDLRWVLGQPHLCLDLRNRATYLQRLSLVHRIAYLANQRLVPADVAVFVGGVDAPLDDVIGLVTRLANSSPGAEQGAAADVARR